MSASQRTCQLVDLLIETSSEHGEAREHLHAATNDEDHQLWLGRERAAYGRREGARRAVLIALGVDPRREAPF